MGTLSPANYFLQSPSDFKNSVTHLVLKFYQVINDSMKLSLRRTVFYILVCMLFHLTWVFLDYHDFNNLCRASWQPRLWKCQIKWYKHLKIHSYEMISIKKSPVLFWRRYKQYFTLDFAEKKRENGITLVKLFRSLGMSFGIIRLLFMDWLNFGRLQSQVLNIFFYFNAS